MLKEIFLAAAAFAFVVGVNVTAPVTTNTAMNREEAAKMRCTDSIVDRLKRERE